MNILITGGNGFIGRNLTEFLEKKHNVFSLVSKTVKNSNIKNQIAIDLAKHDKVRLFFNKFKGKNKIDAIIHLAAKMATAENINDVNILYYNLKITEGVAIITRLLNPKKLINFSSIAVYPNRNGRYNETAEVKPSKNSDCLYGLSKFCSENILDFMLREEKVILSHLRISQVYGKGMREDRVIPAMLKELKKENTITVFGEGKRISNFIRIEKLLEIVNLFLKKDIPGIYNIGGEHLSYLGLAERLIGEYGSKNSKIIKARKGSQVKFYLDTAKIDKAKI